MFQVLSTNLILVLLQLMSVSCSVQEPSLIIQSRDHNLITLGCVDTAIDIPLEGAIFYHDNEVLFSFRNPVQVDPNRVVETINTRDRRLILFFIHRDAEGEFSCAFSPRGARSPPVEVIGESDNSLFSPLHKKN